MNRHFLLQIGSLLMAIGLTTTKSLPEVETTPEPQPEPKSEPELQLQVDLQPSNRTHLEDSINTGVGHFLKLHQLLVGVQDRLFQARLKAMVHLQAIKKNLGEGLKELVLDKFGRKQKKHPHHEADEEEVVIVTLAPNANEIYQHEGSETLGYHEY